MIGSMFAWALASIQKVIGFFSLFFDGREISPPPKLENEPEFTPRDMCSDVELKRVAKTGKERFGHEPAPTPYDLVPGDLFAFQVNFLAGRESVSSWGFARAICPRGEKVLAVIIEPPPGAELLKVGKRIRVPQPAIGQVFCVTCSGDWQPTTTLRRRPAT